MIVVGACCADLDLWHALLQECMDLQLEIGQSDLNEKGGVFHFQVEVKAEWHQMAKFEMALKKHREALAGPALLHWIRSPLQVTQPDYLPYQVELSSVINLDLMSVLTQFFNSKAVKIKSMRMQSYVQAKTGVPLQLLTLSVWIPLEMSLPELRENFMILCDEYNIDAIFEQERI